MNNPTETLNGYDFCTYRLPCGYCKALGADCPKRTLTIHYCDNTSLTTIREDKGLTPINTCKEE